ncbi:MAG TPA: MFS transporter [Verrucomicrobiae bacterium]|jgi:MFS family permease|nr:MFS transporter [Verrucomicrobiae bacterium]
MKSLSGIEANLWKLKIVRLLFWMHFYSAVLVPFYTDWGGLKLSQVLFLNAWFMFWSFAFEVPTGVVADRFGRKTSLACGYFLGAAAALLYVSRPALPVFLAAEMLMAAAYTLHSGADESLAYDSLAALGKTGAAKAELSALESFKLGGIILATAAGGFIAHAWGLAAPMRFYVLPSAAGFFLALSMTEPSLDSGSGKPPSYRLILKEGTRLFFQHKVLWLLASELALTNAMAWGIIWLYQPLLLRAGLPLAYLGVVNALACVGQILFLSSAANLERLLGSKRNLLVFATAAAGLALLGLAAAKPLYLVAGLIVLAFSFGLTRVPIYNAYMHAVIPSEQRATVISMASMARTLAIVVMNPLIGLLADKSLSLAVAALGGSILALTFFSRIEEKHLAE